MSTSGLSPEQNALAEAALAHQTAGRFAEAAQAYVALLARAPQVWPACYNLALVYQHLERLPEAAEMYARAVRINPQLAEGYNNLGNVLKALKNDAAAIEAFEHALALNPQLSEAAYNLATMLQARGQLGASINVLQQAVASNPAHGNAWDALYRGLLGLGRQEEAIQAFKAWEQHLAEPSPELVVAGLALCRPIGDRAREARYLALALAWPFAAFTPEQFSPILGMIQYFDVSREEILRCYRRYDEAVSVRQPTRVPLLSARAADSRLRIGYLSGDFRAHVMGRMMLDVIARHDRNRFNIFLISTCARNQHDEVTKAFRQHADGFADVSELDDFDAAKSIAEADIDVLVDLAGHTNSARPGIYAHRPARSIVTHLGYHGCLGLSAVDNKLTDGVADLADAATYQIETPYALETCVFPFVPVTPAPIDAELGAGLNLSGKFVFGAFVNLLKLSERCLTAWRRVMEASPEAVLLFSPLDTAEHSAIERIIANAGIDSGRIAILPAVKGEAALRARYRLVHAVMDTFPYAGGDTTLAALDMGVPVVSLTGQRQSERIGASILTHLGISEMAVESEEAFIETAVRLGRDTAFMAEIRQKITAATAAAVGRADVYTRALENAFVDIAARKPVPSTMKLTARQFFQMLHDAMRRQAKASDDVERRSIAAVFSALRDEQPHYPPLLRAQGDLAQTMQDLQLASECLAVLLQQFPDDTDTRLMLAGFLVDQGAAADALKILEDVSLSGVAEVRVLKLQVQAHAQLREWEIARQYSDRAIKIAPADVQTLFRHGTILSHVGEIDAALTFLNRTLILAPDYAEAAYNAGVLLSELGNHRDAETVFRRALGSTAAMSAHRRLLQSLKAQRRRSEWLTEARRFAETYPALEYSRLLESRMARHRGELDREAEILLPLAEQAVSLESDVVAAELVNELLAILPFHDVSEHLLRGLHTRYIQATRALHPRLATSGTRDAVPNDSSNLKMGYLVDFSLPFVSPLIVSLAAHRNRERLAMTVYALSPLSTVPQQHLEALGVGVVLLAAFDEQRIAERVQADQIDVLIDASSFGLYEKPGLWPLRPAPIQIGLPGLGRPAGIGDLDYRLSDSVLSLATDVDSTAPGYCMVEGSVFPIMPVVADADAMQVTRASLEIGADAPVFGVLASIEQISTRCAGLWKTLAARLPQAVFLLSPLDADDVTPIRNILLAEGIEAARIFAHPVTVAGAADAALAGLVDVILDTVPGSDYVSVRASLIQGIPIVTMPGRMADERVGLSILSHLGETSTVAASGRDYVDIAAHLASNPDARVAYAARVKPMWQEASLADMPFSEQGFARRLEAAVYRVVVAHRRAATEA